MTMIVIKCLIFDQESKYFRTRFEKFEKKIIFLNFTNQGGKECIYNFEVVWEFKEVVPNKNQISFYKFFDIILLN